MKKIIIIKYGELTTKKDNINFFITTLKDNIKNCLVDYETEIKYDKGRMFIYANEDNLDVAIEKIKKTFGIHEINIGYEIDDNSIENIKKSLIELIKDRDITSFKIVTKRSDKKYPINSMEISRQMGGIVLKNKEKAEVDVHNPKMVINIEVRLNNKVYIYFDKIKGIGGYPVGVAGKGLLMLSGGIDSPVAGYLALKRGVRIEAIYFESPPHTSDAAKNKVISLAKKLSEYSGYVKLHVINFTAIQEAILKNCPHEYLVTIMRRMMYRISERIAKKNNCKVLINGESIGQVASQTLTSMAAINCVTKLPVIRPVACLDKLDIIEIAKNIDTYETSILPFEDCCTIFVPDHPVINPTEESASEYEKSFDFENLISDAVYNENIIKVENKICEEHSSIL
ncbi:MAG: tRNA 4-thiouridine(8) synthase ThiI [Bacilli bacterium]|jgi:thiamine biosynthesis protein ThiI|nr:tRNA 4-thiouridine(8) synthase ThiI [Bacilli bacterium]